MNKELIESLIKARTEFPEIPKNRTAKAGSFSYKYADLSDILTIVVPILSKYGLIITQPIVSTERGMAVKTILYHTSGGSIESVFDMNVNGLNPQQVGSMISYYRRYSICALLGVFPEDDTDAQEIPPPRVAPKPAQVAMPKPKAQTTSPDFPDWS